MMVIATLAACGGSSGGDEAAVSDNAAFCAVFTNDYEPILTSPTFAGEDGFEEETIELVRLASIMAESAPPELADAAQANVSFHEAIRDTEPSSDFVSGNGDTFQYGLDNCS